MGARKAIAWSLNQIAAEFGWARQTVKGRLAQAGAEPSEKDTYTTKQVVAALFGDSDTADMRRKMAEADVAEMERDEKDEKLLPAAAVEAVWQDALGRMKDVIAANVASEDTRRTIFKAMQAIPISEYIEAKLRTGESDPSAES